MNTIYELAEKESTRLPATLKCVTCSAGLSRPQRCRCGMCCRARFARWGSRSAADFGWDGTRSYFTPRTEILAKNSPLERRFGWFLGGRRDGSYLSR
jgi:hypothetical protein